jgi:hypothetical protein
MATFGQNCGHYLFLGQGVTNYERARFKLAASALELSFTYFPGITGSHARLLDAYVSPTTPQYYELLSEIPVLGAAAESSTCWLAFIPTTHTTPLSRSFDSVGRLSSATAHRVIDRVFAFPSSQHFLIFERTIQHGYTTSGALWSARFIYNTNRSLMLASSNAKS